MVTTSARELLTQRLKAQFDSLPDDDPKRQVIASILDGKQEQATGQQEALRRIALDRYYGLPAGDPLKDVLGRILGEGSVPAPEAPPVVDVSNAFRPDAWEAIRALERGQQNLFSAVKTIDARATAAMQEAQRIAARGVEMQEFLNLVLEEVHQNTEMLKGFKETFHERD